MISSTKFDARNTRGRLAILGAIALGISSLLYLASKSSGFRLSTHNYQLLATGNPIHDAQVATSALESLLENDIYVSDLAGKGQRVSALATLLEAIIHDPTIPRDKFFRFQSQEFGWWRLRNNTYLPWRKTAESEVTSGIVMCVGQRDLVLAVQNIRTLRNVLGSTLPIEVFYAGERDFPSDKRKQFEDLDLKVQILNILDFYDDTAVGITDSLAENGWVMKPFAMLASRFQKAILVDADTIFLQRPDDYFDPQLKETGTLFYPDRAVKGEYTGWIDTLEWVKKVLQDRNPSAMLKKSIFWTAKLEHQQESGLVFMDKGKPGVFTSLMFAAWMNTKAVRAYVGRHVFGDKETFWLACELTSTPYYFNPFYAGMIGHFEVGAKKMCSVQLLHLDSKGSPFWINGGLRENKRWDQEIGQKDFANLTHYIPAGVTWAEQPRLRYLKHGLCCTDTKAGQVKSLEKTGLTKVIEDMIVEATEIDKMFPD